MIDVNDAKALASCILTHTHTNNQSNIKQRQHVLGYEDLGLFHKHQPDRLSSVRLRTEAGNYLSNVAELSG